jgi:hypothetical protein
MYQFKADISKINKKLQMGKTKVGLAHRQAFKTLITHYMQFSSTIFNTVPSFIC